MQQIRDQAQSNEQSTPQLSNQTKIYLGLIHPSYGTEATEHYAYSQNAGHHAHHEVLQTWHQQMHEHAHRRHRHPSEASNYEATRTSLINSPDSGSMRYLIGLNERTGNLDYSGGSSGYQQHERHESNYYAHSSRRHSSQSHYAASNHYTTSDLSTTTQPWNAYQRHTESAFATSQESLQHTIAMLALKNADRIGTIGDCARGPRLTYKELGLVLPEVSATEQGRILENTGLFERVARADVQPGDYGYRHWTSSVIRSHHGVDKGDSFIVANVGRNGVLSGANDHHFVVPGDGGRYRDTTFLRPTAAFYTRYAALIQQKSSTNA